MIFELGCELDYLVQASTTLILNVDAQRTAQQLVVRESFETDPFVSNETHAPGGTSNLYRRLLLEPGRYKIRYSAQVEVSPMVHDPSSVSQVHIRDLPLRLLPYLYPSRFCQSDRLQRFAWRQFGKSEDGHSRVTAICNWIYDNVDYLSGSSGSETSAYDTFTLRAGVCRDFAHLGITFCRALGIPARFVSAYGWQLEPQDFHAVFEAYLGGRWYLFDASRLCPLDGIVRIGVGRDAADTAFATFYGSIEDAPKRVWIEPSGHPTCREQWTTAAVSLSSD